MTERIELRAEGPKPRLISHIVAVLVRGGLIAYPTDSGYALGWRSENRKAQERVVRLRQLEGSHHFTYCCRSLSDVSRYAKVSNWAHRLIRQLAPGPYTFVLPATSEVPRTLRAALQALDESAVLRSALGDKVVEHYLHAGNWEQAEYDRRVTDWEVIRNFERA